MSELPQTRQSLLLELGKHSDHAWTEFLAVYEQAIFRYCQSKGLQEADARDVTQDVLAVVHKRIPSWDFEASGSFRAWLFRVARNVSIDAIKKRARHAKASGDSGMLELLNQVPGDDQKQGDFDTQYQRSLFEWASKHVKSEVKDITWQSFSRTAVDGQKAEDVASDLGVSVGSVYTAKCRVVARIRQKISELEA